MMLLPIVERELRVASRQWRTYWSRSIAGSAALLLVLQLIWTAGQLSGPAAGMMLFKVASYIALFFCLFAGVSRTSDTLSSEKREDTLGLLFLTHLKAHDIVLGKLVAASIHAALFLLSILPILSIPVMLGGVSTTNMVRVPISLLNALLLSLSVGILASTLLRAQRQTAFAASMTMLILSVGLPGLGVLLRDRYEMVTAAAVLSLPSPFVAHETSLGSGMGLTGQLFRGAIGLQTAMAVTAIVSSCLILPHTWRVKSGVTIPIKEKLRHWILGTPEQRRARRQALLEKNPIFWLGARERFAALWPALVMFGGLGLAAGIILYNELPKGPAWIVFFAILSVIDFYLRTRVATIAATLFSRERQMGTWEMILSTPLTLREIIKGNVMTVRHQLLRTYLLHMLIFVTSVCLAMWHLDGDVMALWIAGMAAMISIGEFVVLGYAGMWRGMRAPIPVHAPGQAILRVTLLPWILWAPLIPLLFRIPFVRQEFERSPRLFLIGSCIIWGISTALAYRVARRNLLHYFRQPYDAPSPLKFARRLLELLSATFAGTSQRATASRSLTLGAKI